MVHYSIIVPCRDATASAGRLIAELVGELDRLILPYEIILVDDGSTPAEAHGLQSLASDTSAVRVLRFGEPRGTSAALTAGVAASRGDLVLGVPSGSLLSMRYLPHLIARLSQSDFVFAESERSLAAQLGHAVGQFGRAAVGSRRMRGGDELFWAARREAVAGIALSGGAFRVLPAIVAHRRFRVCRLLLAQGLPPQGGPYALNLFGRALAAWLDGRFEPHLASELANARSSESARFELARGSIARASLAPKAAAAENGPHQPL